MSDNQAIRDAARVIRSSRHAVALTGAGISVESGIPTYRGEDGIWSRIEDISIDGWDLFASDPKQWWEQVIARGSGELAEAIDRAEPNAGHVAMAQLEEMGRLAHLITQNIDNLHRRAGSKRLTEIHGNRYLVRCMNCGGRDRLETIPLDRLPPLCPECGGILKTDVVMFGEPIPEDALNEGYRQAASADVFITVGTSAMVHPAADFPLVAKRHGAPLIEINPNDTALTDIADIVIRAPAGVALPALVELLAQEL